MEKVIDFRDTLSSISLLKVSQVFGKMKPSEILEIRGADATIRQDLFKVLPRAAFEVVQGEQATDGDFERLRIRKCS